VKLSTIRKLRIGGLLGLAAVLTAAWIGQFHRFSTQIAFSPDLTADETRSTPASQITFLAVGDIMLSRGVATLIEREGDRLVPFSNVAAIFDEADFSFGNLESPVSGDDSRKGRGLIFNTQQRDIDGLFESKFRIVTLANNHAMDQGVAGLRHTRDYLSQLGIWHVGVGEDKREAWRGKVVTVEGFRVGFVAAAYSSINDNGSVKNDYVARIEDFAYLRESVAQLKAESDIVVVAMHAGTEYTRKPHASQVEFARTAIDCGADVVIGSHPHWIQTIEKYRGKYIFYSLGNFVFDQRRPDTKEGLMLRIAIRRGRAGKDPSFRVRIDHIDLLPVIIERLGVPRPASPGESTAILGKIGVSDTTLIP